MSRLTKIFGLAILLFYSKGLAAQDRAIEYNFSWTVAPPLQSHSTGELILARVLTAGVNAGNNALIAKARGKPVWPTFKKSLIVAASAEAVYEIDRFLDKSGMPSVPLRFTTGQIAGSLLANISSDRVWCSDVEVVYLLVKAQYDCGRMGFSSNLQPLLPAAYFLAKGMKLDWQTSFGEGLSFFYSDFLGQGIEGHHLAGTAVYRTKKHWETNLRNVEKSLLSFTPRSPHESALQQRALNYVDEQRRILKLNQLITINHEVYHAAQHRFIEAVMERSDSHSSLTKLQLRPPGFLDKVGLKNELTFYPLSELGQLLINIIPDESWSKDFRPFESTARTAEEVYIKRAVDIPGVRVKLNNSFSVVGLSIEN